MNSINKLSTEDLQRLNAHKVETITHPECDLLKMDIYKLNDEECWFANENGDWYDSSWVEGAPLAECKADAMSEMNQRVAGTWGRETIGERSERETFSAM